MKLGLSIAALLLGMIGAGRSDLAIAQCALPNQLTNGQVADATQVMGNFNALQGCLANSVPAGTSNAIQTNNGSGGFGSVGPLSNGQVLIGSTGSPARAATLTPGAGIAIANLPGSITISASGGGGGGVDWLNAAAVVQPVANAFTLQTSTTPPPSAALTATSRGMVLSTSGSQNGTGMMAEVSAPSGHWQATMLAAYAGPLSNYNLPSIAVRDSVNNKAVELGIGGNGSGSGWRFDYQKTSGGIGLDSYNADTSLVDTGFPPASEPVWSRITYNGTTLVWSFSRDGEHFVTAFTASATDYLSNLSTIGPALTFTQTQFPSWPSYMHVFSWTITSM